MPQRKRARLRRRTPQRRRRATLVLVFAVAALLVIVFVIVARQYSGYFTGHRPTTKSVAVNESPSPQATVQALPTASASPQALPSASPSGPRVAIIIDDCGYNLPRDVRFLKLPIPVTLSILPLTPHGKEVAAAAEAAGKAVMLHIPMEPESATAHPGPGEISTEMTDEQIETQLAADMASLPPLPGANNHMGSKASSDQRVMRDVIGRLKQGNMFFIDSMTAMTSVGESTARELGVPTAARDVFLDNQVNVPYIKGQIEQLEAVARKNGAAIAIGHPNPETAQALEEMIPRMLAAGFNFVNAQDLVK